MAAPVGNQNAAKAKLFEGALRRALNANSRDRLYDIAEKLVQAAEAGESWAIQHVADRLDGKPKQQTEITGAGENGELLIAETNRPKLSAEQWLKLHGLGTATGAAE